MFQENKFRGVNLVGNTYNLPKSFSTLIYFTGFRKTWILEHSYTVTFPLNFLLLELHDKICRIYFAYFEKSPSRISYRFNETRILTLSLRYFHRHFLPANYYA